MRFCGKNLRQRPFFRDHCDFGTETVNFETKFFFFGLKPKILRQFFFHIRKLPKTHGSGKCQKNLAKLHLSQIFSVGTPM